MKGFFKLLNYEVSQYLIKVIVICFGTIVSPLLFLNGALSDIPNLYKRFENVYESSGSIIVFAIYFAAIFGICIQSFYSNYSGSKSIYTLLTFPMKREVIYFSKLISFLTYFMMFFSAQLISVFIGYAMTASKAASWQNGSYFMTNGLFLAFMRSSFLRTLFPFGIGGIISTVSMFVVIICGLYYGLLCERSHRLWGFVPIIATIFLLIRVITYRINQNRLPWEYINLYIYSIIFFCISSFFIWGSIRLLKRGAIV